MFPSILAANRVAWLGLGRMPSRSHWPSYWHHQFSFHRQIGWGACQALTNLITRSSVLDELSSIQEHGSAVWPWFCGLPNLSSNCLTWLGRSKQAARRQARESEKTVRTCFWLVRRGLASLSLGITNRICEDVLDIGEAGQAQPE